MSKAKDFVQEAEKLMDANDTLWLSFQANSTSDLANTNESFNKHIQAWKEELKKGNFVLPSFSANMRNSQQISSVTLDREGSNAWKMNEELEKLTSTVTGEKPTLIMIDERDTKKELGNIFKDVIDKQYNLKDTKNLVVLYQARDFKSNEIESELKKITTKKVNVFDPRNLDEQVCENNLINFLRNENQILVVDQDLFTGCESSNIVCLISDDYSGVYTVSIRCALLRAVSHLTLILTINNDGGYYFNVNGFHFQSKYLKCAKQSEVTWHCESCKIKNVCKPCLLFCHKNHQFKKDYNYDYRNGIKCECKNVNCCKISSTNVT